MLRATTARNFSSLLWPAGSAPAALASLLFDPPEPQLIGKTQCFATFLPFAHLYLLSSYSFSSDLLSSNLPLLSASALLCFSSLHIVGSLTSKLPSNSINKPWLSSCYPVLLIFDPLFGSARQASEGSCLNRDHLRKYHKTCKPRDSDAVSGVKPRGFHVSCFYVSFIILNLRRHWVMTKNRDTIRIDPVFLLKSVGPCNHHTDSNPIVNWSWATICFCVKIGYPKISCLIITFASSRAQGLLWGVPYFSEKRMMGLESTVAPPNLIFHLFFLSNCLLSAFSHSEHKGMGQNFWPTDDQFWYTFLSILGCPKDGTYTHLQLPQHHL